MTDTQDPERVREEIEQTRQDLGHTVEALAAKTDVKAQARRKVEETKSTAREKKENLLDRAHEAAPDGAVSAASEVRDTARSRPMPFAIAGAFAVGVLAGRVTKRSGKHR